MYQIVFNNSLTLTFKHKEYANSCFNYLTQANECKIVTLSSNGVITDTFEEITNDQDQIDYLNDLNEYEFKLGQTE